MEIKEIIFELLQKEIIQLKKADYARPNDYVGMDRYDSKEELMSRTKGFDKFRKIQSIMHGIEQHLDIKTLSQQVPDWREILEELIQNELEQLEKQDYARRNDLLTLDRYDSDKELHERAEGFDKYSKLTSFKAKLDATKEQDPPKNFIQRLTSAKKPQESLFDEER